ncbi:uncharacterized protein LOC127008459, partial [Eriocheir sinensis]|uniref:uncharacterized protein LOC127008459 n=1 Tax=Eriocheir sinensis TaxID=95602 RepID=UPI0021C73D69
MAQGRSKLYGFKVISILDGKGKDTMLRVLTWGTPGKSPSQSLDEYLNSLPKDSTASYPHTRNRFTKHELNQLRQSPSCSQCDITMLFKAIKLACEGVAGFESQRWVEPSKELEYLLTCIKNKRNETFHGAREMSYSDFLRTVAELRELLEATLMAAGDRYGRQETEVTKEIEGVHREIDRIMQEVLGEEELLARKGDALKKDFIEEAGRRVRQMLEATVHLDPMSFLSGACLRPHVQSMFCRVRIKQNQPGYSDTDIEYSDILTLVQGSQAPQSEETRPLESPPTPARGGAGPMWLRIASTIRRIFRRGRPRLLLVQGVAGSGKTTLLALIMAEYMKDEGQRTLRGLGQYELLLRAQCRDHHSSSLADLLQQLMPEQFIKYRNLQLPLIKRCRVLFLIDGLDEANENSEKLVHNILFEAKDAPSFTLVCTSRPERVTSFVNKIPSQYEVIRVELTGVPESERLTFVLRYHRLITEQLPVCRRSENDLKHIMEKIGAREQFRLPLNLLFLIWIISHDICISPVTITQAELYLKTHQLCQQKLLDRLCHSPTPMDRWTLEKNLREVLQMLYRVSLVGLSRCQLSLTKDEEDSLRSACVARGLPHQEVLSAFLGLKATWTPWGMQEQYSAPHKGLQDFYAALCVVPLAGKGNPKAMKQEIFGTDKVDLSRFQYMLQLVAALLPQPVTDEAAQQVVDLLKRSGVRNEDQWLNIIEETKAAPAIVSLVAQHFPVPQDIMVTDSHVRSYTALLPHLPPARVGIVLNKEVAAVAPLLDALAGHTCTRLMLRHHFRYPRPDTTSDAILQQVKHSNTLEGFGGHLSEEGVGQLPPSLKSLSVAVLGGGRARGTLLALSDQPKRLPLLRTLEVHMPLGSITAPSSLPPLPDAGDVSIYLSGLSDETVVLACKVAGALQPPSGYMGICFSGAAEVTE